MSSIYDQQSQQPPRLGLLLLQGLIVLLFAVFSLRLWFLQIHQGEEYAVKARDNQLRKEAMFAPRGLIRDRHETLVAVNEPAYGLGVVREDVRSVEATLEQVSRWTGRSYDELLQTFRKKRRKVKPFEPLILINDLTFEQAALIESNALHWPGLEIQVKPRRKYHFGVQLAHILGYVAEADEEEMEADKDLALGDDIGKQGLEVVMERRLRGVKGLQQFEVDVSGRRLQETVIKKPRAGRDITLSIDLGLQQLGMDMLTGREGAVVVMDPDTGQLYALVSGPSYDSNAFTAGLTPDEWAILRDDPRKPMQNRAIQSVYPPGSVFKLAVAAAALKSGMVDPHEKVFCSGATTLGNHTFRCWRKGGHGHVDMERALIESCDVYFYKMGRRLGVDRIGGFGLESGFGKRTGIDLPHEKGGIMPTREWKRKRFGERWQGGDDLNLSIGQGYTLTSPLQVARFIAAVINGGKLVKPQLLRDVPVQVDSVLDISPDHLDRVKTAMIRTVTDSRGTCRRIRTKGVVAGAKTGTAQVVRLTDELKKLKDHQIPYRFRDHAWMAGFAEQGSRRFVIVAMVEHGLHGSSGAGPVVKAMIDYIYFNGKRPREIKPPVRVEVPESFGRGAQGSALGNATRTEGGAE